MSGSTLTDADRSGTHRSPAGLFAQATLGARVIGHAGLFAPSARGIDNSVPALRSGIATPSPATEPRLPWAIAAMLIVVLSVALWLYLFEVFSFLAHELARIF